MDSSKIDVVNPEPWMIEYLAANLRDSDLEDYKCVGVPDGRKALLDAFGDGEVVCVALVEKTPTACFCVSRRIDGGSLITPKRYCWLVGTDGIARTGFGGLKKSLYYIGMVISCFGHLYTFVDDNNQKARRYVAALGFNPVSYRKLEANGKTATYWERIK